MANAVATDPRHSDWTRHPALRAAVVILLGLSVVSAALLGSGMLSEDAAYNFSQLVYSVVPVCAGTLVVAAAMTLTGRNRVAWITIGSGVLAWGIGEIIWVFYEFVLKTEVPYPGWADVAYVAGYPLMFAGILLLPHVRPRRLERLRLTLDALAGSVAVGAIMWVTYLGDQVYFDPEAGILEQVINLFYAFGDAFLLVGLMILAVRRSTNRFDVRIVGLAAGMVATAIADVLYIPQVEAETYTSGGRLDSLWIIGYAAFAVAGWYLFKPVKTTEQADRASRIWQMGAPYGAIGLLFGLTLWDIGGNASVLEMASGIVGILIIIRQGVAIRENRELVETQRNDLIASISHELRTPLTGVTGFTSLLNSEWDSLDDSERSEMIAIVDSQAQHVNRIVTDLIGIARDTLHSTNLQLDNHDVGLIVRDAVAMVPELAEGRIKLDIEAEQGLAIEADRGRIIQVLVNLLTNAVRYGNGRILLDVHANKGRIEFQVHDSGEGVPKKYEETIWDRFERGAHRLDATVPGSGIGLPIARSLVEAHRGTIEYHRSNKLGGASFTVSLPQNGLSAKPNLQPTGTAA